MDDDKLYSLFSDFKPDVSSDFQFMSRLRHNLNTVEIIRQHTAELRSRNKKAIAIAAVVGFIVGFLCSLSLPYLNEAVLSWQLSLPSEVMMKTFAENFSIIAWIVIAGTTVLAALNTYEISLSLLKPKDSPVY